MTKKDIYTFRGISQDTTKSKHSKEFYYEGNNIRITSTDSQSTGSITNEKGNDIVLTIPIPTINHSTATISYGTKQLKYSKTFGNEIDALYQGKSSENQIIIGDVEGRGCIYLFTTDGKGFDCIWEFTDDPSDITLLYLRSLGFSTSKPIQAIFNYENDIIQKLYWVDGDAQLRFLNTKQSKANGDITDLIDVDSNAINIVGDFSVSQPQITSIDRGGIHTSGMIQYSYNLYNLNGAQTKLSPLSSLVPLGKGNGGGEVNEVVGAVPVLTIQNIDNRYTHIKIYAIKYTSYNQIPNISLIEDKELNGSTHTTIRDDGRVINEMSLSEFLFLGSDPVSPKHIATKDNVLFLANLKNNNFDVKLDTRAYGFDSFGVARIKDPKTFNFISPGRDVSDYKIGDKENIINADYSVYKYQSDGITLGGEGKHIKYELVETTINTDGQRKLFKDNELYRIGIEFYNKLGQVSFPKWIADFIAPEGNLQGKYYSLKVSLKSDFFVWLNTSENFKNENDKPIGYRILRANRTLSDRTIICQGLINGMISNHPVRRQNGSGMGIQYPVQTTYGWREGTKVPSLQRPFGQEYKQLRAVKEMEDLTTGPSQKEREFYKAPQENQQVSTTLQFNKLMQMYSPDVMFGSVPTTEGLTFRVKGALKNKHTYYWGQERNIETKLSELEAKSNGFGLSPRDGSNVSIKGDPQDIADYGLIGPHSEGNEDPYMAFYQFYRDYDHTFYVPANKKNYLVLGSPELTDKGQGVTYYNNDPELKYVNSLETVLTHGTRGINRINSFGSKCITFALGVPDTDLTLKMSLDKLYSEGGFTETNVALVGEFIAPPATLYTGNYYGGNGYEERKRTNYIAIGSYISINPEATGSHITISSPGDTYVQSFKFAKIVKTDTEIYDNLAMQITELVNFKVETSVNLKMRNDISNGGWDGRFQPRDEEYHKYNRVYSQEPTLIETRDAEYTFKPVDHFDTKIMTTKIKTPGESIDSWTDLSPNDIMYLDGKYGPITNLHIFKDELYALQPKGFSYIAVNPRVQVQGSDGIAVELGSGKLLHDYKYFTDNTGCSNKWGTIVTESGIYFVDLLNKGIYRFNGQLQKLSTTKGLHSWMNSNLDTNLLLKDNPLLGTGINMGYDKSSHSVYTTFHQTNPYTIMFDEMSDTFVSFMDYIPSRYMSMGDYFYTPSPYNYDIYKHFVGEYNMFYGQHYPSYVTLLVNPAVNYQCVFDSIEFNSELYLNDLDQPNKTLTHISAWNEYQQSGRIPLTFGRGKNLDRKFRTWRAQIPREGRKRMRNPWLYLKLELDNTDNYKLILHDIIVSYTIS